MFPQWRQWRIASYMIDGNINQYLYLGFYYTNKKQLNLKLDGCGTQITIYLRPHSNFRDLDCAKKF